MLPVPCPQLKIQRALDPETAFSSLDLVSETVMAPVWQKRIVRPGFLPARVRMAWDAEGLHVAAEMEDMDIFNPASQPGDATWGMGDVFEIFLRHEEQPMYHEFHVTPANQRLALCFPENWLEMQEAAYPAKLSPFTRALPSGCFQSATHVDSSRNRWWALVILPWNVLLEPGRRLAENKRWKFSFCRYDYTHGAERPICSSTSPHLRFDFHEQSAWRTLELQSPL